MTGKVQVEYDVEYEDAAAAAQTAAVRGRGGGSSSTVVASSFSLALDEGIRAERLVQDATFRDNLERAVYDTLGVED